MCLQWLCAISVCVYRFQLNFFPFSLLSFVGATVSFHFLWFRLRWGGIHWISKKKIIIHRCIMKVRHNLIRMCLMDTEYWSYYWFWVKTDELFLFILAIRVTSCNFFLIFVDRFESFSCELRIGVIIVTSARFYFLYVQICWRQYCDE